MDFFKTWILPPLIGAIIGYFTNWLAIKMLFRPYKTIRIAGMQLPFTPGILPREKAKLAGTLGNTVAQELLTPQVITKRIQSPEIQKAAAGAVKTALEGFLAQDIGRLFSSRQGSSLHDDETLHESSDVSNYLSENELIDQSDASPPDGSSLSPYVMESFRRLVSSVGVQASIKGIFAEFLARVGEMEVRDLVSKEQFVGTILRAVPSFEDKDSPGSMRPGGEPKPHHLLHALAELPPDATIRALSDTLVPKAYNYFLPHIDSFLHDDEFRARLEVEAHAFVKKALNRLGTVQRLFVSIAGYDTKIAQAMPGIIEDLVQTIERLLREPSTPGKISEALCATLIAQRSKLDAQTPDAPESVRSEKSKEDKAILDVALLSLKDSSEELRQRAEKSYDRLAELQIKELVGISVSAEDISGFVLSAFVRTTGAHGDSGISSTTIGALFVQVLRESSKDKTMAEFLGVRDEEIEQISLTLADALLKLIETRIPAFVDAIDIRSMVSEKIDSLNMKEVERIVLQVVRKELAWITWIGGILGAMIGIVQSIISIL
ncbi:MAG: hypothetical protein SAMD01599839_03870 [Rectinema sp.]